MMKGAKQKRDRDTEPISESKVVKWLETNKLWSLLGTMEVLRRRRNTAVDDDNDYESHVKDVDDDYENDGGDEVSDDSMASDASSGPSNRLPNKIIKHATKQVYIQKRQNTEKTLSNEGEKSELKARTRTSAASRVQSRGKSPSLNVQEVALLTWWKKATEQRMDAMRAKNPNLNIREIPATTRSIAVCTLIIHIIPLLKNFSVLRQRSRVWY
ncbi:hypothetical protein Bca101_055259 [Brassica carinata]